MADDDVTPLSGVLVGGEAMSRPPIQLSPVVDFAGSPDLLPPTAIGPLSTNLDLTGLQNLSMPVTDRRVRLRAMANQEDRVYGDKTPTNLMAMLHDTNGMLFPYTPTITFTQDVDYRTVDLVHTNGDFPTYSRTPSVSLSVSGKFSVQNQAEGQYAMAALHFLRSASKMYFGENEEKDLAGLPPPVLLFSGYGPYMFNDLKVILKNHSYTIDDTVHGVDVTLPGSDVVRLPALFTVAMTLGVVQTPRAMRQDFKLSDFRSGALMKKGGWI